MGARVPQDRSTAASDRRFCVSLAFVAASTYRSSSPVGLGRSVRRADDPCSAEITQMDIIKRFRVADVIILSTVAFPFLKHVDSLLQFTLFMATVLAYNYFMFSFNDYMDRDKDYHDLNKRERNPFLNTRYQKPATILMALSGVVLLSTGFADIHKAYVNVALFLVAYSYSAGIRAKNKPFLDVIIHGGWILGMIIYAISFFNLAVTIKEITVLVQFLIISTALELSQGIRDYAVDRDTNENTTVVYWGPKKTKLVYATLILIYSAITPVLAVNPYLRYVSLLFIPIFFATKQDTFDQRAIIVNFSALLSGLIYWF
jgi:4-hydroxybenzoate polyprenyltransferase